MGFRARNGSDRMRTIWTPEMDRYFIDLMLEQVVKGNRIDDHLFSKRAWEDMTSLFNEKFKFQYEKDILKNRHKTLRNLYRAIKNLLSQKGFSWDKTRQMVRADNKAWDDYIRVHPDARSYRIKTIPYYNDLCEIYKYATTEGKDSLSSQNAKVNSSTPRAELGGLLEGPRSPSPSTPWDNGDTSENLDSFSNSGGTTTAIGIHLSNVCEASGGGLHDITIDEDYGISAPKGAGDDTTQRTNDMGSTLGIRSRTYWQPPMDRYFIDLMLEQMQKGNQVDGQFRKHAWMEMLESFNTKFGFKYDVDILKNRYKTMKRQHNVIKNLLELDGFAWDNVRQMVTADDSIWQDYIKAHTDARQYMTRPVPYYKDLCIICRDLSADVKDGALGYNNLEQHDEVAEMKLCRTVKGLQSPPASVSSGDQESSHIGLRNSVADQRNKRPSEDTLTPANSKKARGKDEECMANALREMATAVSTLTDKKKGNDSTSSITVEHVIEGIQALPDMDEDLVLDACDYLEDDKRAKTFLALDVKLRKKWLIRKLRPDGIKD